MRVAALYETVAGTSALDGVRSSNVPVVTVVGSMSWSNVAVTGRADRRRPVAPLAGVVPVTAGGGAEVVNDQTTSAASALPAASFTRGSVAPPRSVAV